MSEPYVTSSDMMPNSVPIGSGISRATMANIRQNLVFAFGYNALGIPVAAGVLYPLSGLLLSPMAVFFSDVVELVGVVLTLMYFLTPCFYPLQIVSDRSWFWIVRYNPVRSILEIFRDPIYLNKIPPLPHFLVATGVTLAVLIIGSIVFRHSSAKIPFYV